MTLDGTGKTDTTELDKTELPPETQIENLHSSPTKDRSPKDLEAALALLKKKDSTSRFVGLTLLKPVLEQELRDIKTEENRSGLVKRCWEAIPVKFLDGLLKARTSEKTSKDEAKNMIALAVGVLHAFMTLLESPQTEDKFMGRIPLLRVVIRSCPPETKIQIMNIFHTLVMTPQGSSAIFASDVKGNDSSEKPESYLFITMLLIDIRSTIPSLQEKLHSEEYPATSERLSTSYDIISAFIAFLIQSLDSFSTNDDNPHASTPSAPMPVDLLLKLRTNISETMSLTIEHLRDRYDSSTAGAAGLHPSARAPLKHASSSSPLPIAWDTSTGLVDDPLTLSQLRTLSLWLRDEENDSLRKEAAGIMDVLLALHQHKGEQDFRSPVLIALEGILETSEGIEAFLREEGWSLLAPDLPEILRQPQNHTLGIDIIRVLLSIVEADVTGPAKEEWMSIVELAQTSLTQISAPLELPIAVSQLAVELMIRAPRGIRKKHRSSALELLAGAKKLLGRQDVDREDRDGLEEVVQGLQSLELQNQMSGGRC